jgi:hypothetical protein
MKIAPVLVALAFSGVLLACKGTCVTGSETDPMTTCQENYSKGVCDSMTGATFHSENCAALGYTRKVGENGYAKPK